MTRHRYPIDRFRFDPTDGTLADPASGESVRLRPQAAALLAALLAAEGRVVDRETLARAVWGEERVVDFDAGLAALLREIRAALRSLGGNPDRIETLPRRGVRVVAPEPAGRARRPLRWLIPAGAALAVAGAIAAAWVLVSDRAAGPAAPWSLALMPLEGPATAPGGPRTGILLADTLLAELWQAELPGLELIGRAGMRPYAGRADAARAVAADLGVDLLLEGSYRSGPAGWRLDVRLLATPPGRVVWARTLEGGEPALPVADVAARLVEQLAGDWPRLRRELGDRGRTALLQRDFMETSGRFDGLAPRAAAVCTATQPERTTA